jgi:hypothetical protein
MTRASAPSTSPCCQLLYPGIDGLRSALSVVVAGRAIFINEIVRSYIHRIAGVVLIAVSLFHVWYVIKTQDGRSMIKDMLPDWKDVTDVRDAFRYYLGIAINARCLAGSPTPKRWNTGRWFGACS